MVGRTLGHYRILEKIGAGGMGVVYRARDERLDRDVALKVLPAEMLTDSAAVASFRKEAHLLSRLNHPNIATIHDFDSQDGLNYLVMEYIPGVTLNQKVAVEALSQKEVIRLGVQLAQGLQAAHSEGVIHRDLKPSNLRVTPDCRLKILDFGLAKLIRPISTDDTQTATPSPVVGTLPYMSPEQLQGEIADVRSDIYSAGVVLYEMVTRRRPFADAHGPQLTNAILHLSPQPPMERNRQVSLGMQNVILKSLDKNPEQRYQSARELQVDLERLTPSVITTTPSPSTDQSQNLPLEIAHILFMDIVGYSLFPMDQQRHILRELQKSVCGDSEFARAKSADQLISLPTGDGMALVFFGDPEAPCKCALQVSRALRDHSEIKLRMGVHSGPIYRVPDINDSRNVAGGGINIAQRVMDCGQAGHILVSKAVADVLGQLRSWSGSLHEVGEIEVKHGARIHVFNLYTADAGNLDPPRKLGLTKVARKGDSHRGKSASARPGPRQSSTKSKVSKSSAIPRVTPASVPKPSRIWLSAAASVFLISMVALAIPTSRHWVLSFTLDKPAIPAGVPSLLNGHYLAVLPFGVKGDPSRLRSIAEGLDEALVTKLFTLQDLSVASSQATRKVDLMQPLQTIAGLLGVNLVVKGIVEGTASGIRITVTLDDVLDNKHLLNDQFSGTGADVLSLEDEIFAHISKVLNPEPREAEVQRAPSRPTDNSEAYDLYSQGRVAFLAHPDVKSLRTAISFYDEALKKDPNFSLACARLADAQLAMYQETRDTQWIRDSMKTAQRSQLLNAKLPEAYIALGNVYEQTGRSEEAIIQFKRALQLSPKSDEGFRRLGSMYLSTGNKEKALLAFQNAIVIFPNYWLNYNEIGAAYLQLGENDKALEAYNRVIQLDPDNYLGYMNKGNAYFQKASFHESIVQYRKALELQAGADVYSNLGVAYFYLGRYSEAIPMGQKAVELHPNNELAVGNLAASYFWAGDKKRAIDAYDKAIALANKDLEVNPNDSSTLGDLAVYTAKKGDIQRALYYIKMARSISPSDFVLLSEDAQIRVLANQPTQALESLQLAFENGYPTEQAKLDPELGSLQNNPQFEKLVQKMTVKNK
jgi:serine/threonine protein kinase/tetratricopeptide (TPR) repeat protein